MELRDKVALVTGGSRGIGRNIAITLATAGAKVALTYKDQAEAAEDVVKEIKQEGGEAIAIPMDVCDRRSVEDAVQACTSAYGKLSTLVNNAGINKPCDFDVVTDNDWDEVLAVNLKGPFICSQVALPALRQSQGSIINIGSVSGQYGGPRTAHYAASKAGLISLGQVIARFAADSRVRCNTLSVGLIASDMADQSLQSSQVKNIAQSILLGRLGTGLEVAQAVLFLASDSSDYITAQNININGGLYF